MKMHNLLNWFEQVGEESSGGQAPISDPTQGATAPSASIQRDPNQMPPNPPEQGGTPQMANPQDDVTQDPQTPDMPEENSKKDFETFRRDYLKEIIKNTTENNLDMLKQVMDDEGLDTNQKKFVEDNYQIQMLRRQSNIEKASHDIVKQIKSELDRNNPSVSIVNHMLEVLESQPELTNIFIKLSGTYGMKGDLHRKFMCALIGGVQVGSGAEGEDIIFNDNDYSIRISTRFNSRFGDVYLGKWNLRQDEPEKFLTEPELRRMSDGSPEERDVLKRRVIMESLAQLFKQRSFIVNVVGNDGSVFFLGWDISTSLRAAYTEGKLLIKLSMNDNQEAMINADGQIVPLQEIKIMFEKETGELDEEGKPEKEEHEFIRHSEGQLFLTANLDIMRIAASSFQGVVMRDLSFKGNPSDIKVLQRCHPSVSEILMRQC